MESTQGNVWKAFARTLPLLIHKSHDLFIPENHGQIRPHIRDLPKHVLQVLQPRLPALHHLLCLAATSNDSSDGRSWQRWCRRRRCPSSSCTPSRDIYASLLSTALRSTCITRACAVVVGNKLIHSGAPAERAKQTGGKYYYTCDVHVFVLCCPRRLMMRRMEEDFAAEYYMYVMRM